MSTLSLNVQNVVFLFKKKLKQLLYGKLIIKEIIKGNVKLYCFVNIMGMLDVI